MTLCPCAAQDMDPENVGKETILKVTDWLRGIWEMRRRASGPVQQWIDSIPSSAKSDIVIASECEERSPSHEHKPLTPTEPKDIPFSKDLKPPSMTVSAPINVPNSPTNTMSTPVLPSSLPHQRLARDASFQSDSSHCSSVESLLELRRADPAAILLDLGFGGSSASPQENGTISRIPRRFLQPSSLRGIAIDDFLKQQQETTESFDSVSLGYRGLTGSPYVAPSEIVQKIMERLREHDSHETDTSLCSYDQHISLQDGKLSVLSPNNRQFLEQPRSKSPDMRNKRMIIGQKSFAFGCDGNLIEISTSDTKLTYDTINDYNNLLDTGESIELKQSSPEGSITFEHQYLSKYDKKLAKQLSFDDTVEFSETDQLSKDDRGSQSSLNIAQSGINLDDREQESYASDIISRRHEFSDTRRASVGSCDTKPSKNKTFYGRRFSDGAMRIAERQSKEHALTREKRKSLKRQSKVCDTTAIHHCDLSPIRSSIPSIVIIEPNVDKKISSVVTSSVLLNTPESFKSIEDKNDLESKIDTESSFSRPNYLPSSSNVSESIDRLECFEIAQEDSASSDHSCTEDNQACCYKGKICKDCKHGKNCPDCCCHVNKRKYRKKMEKIMQENKRLEDMLARSRREVAEIRDMLNSVLSVRMEPGF